MTQKLRGKRAPGLPGPGAAACPATASLACAASHGACCGHAVAQASLLHGQGEVAPDLILIGMLSTTSTISWRGR
eukprot:7564698-Pyramimonas_sp.AAC.1